MTLPGNHERDCPNSGDGFYPYVKATDSGETPNQVIWSVIWQGTSKPKVVLQLQ